MTHDFYQLEKDTTSQALNRVNQFGQPRLTTVSSGTSLRLSGKRFLGFTANKETIDTVSASSVSNNNEMSSGL